MIVKELHINTRLELDKINSSLYDDILDEEIDYYLNKAQTELIKQRYNPKSNQYIKGFEYDEKRTVDLKNIHVTNYVDTCYTTSTTNQYRFKLPQDFMFLTSQQAQVYYNYCKAITTSDVTTTKTYFAVPFTPNQLTSGNYSNFRLSANTTANSILTAITGYQYPNDTTNFIYKLQESVNSNYTIYYQGYYTVYRTGYLYIEAPVGTSSILVSYDGGSNYTSYGSSTLSLTNKIGTANGTREYNALRRVQIDDLAVMLKDSFAKPNPEEPLGIEQTNFIDSYTDGSFIIEQLSISYIRSPKPISLSLNVTSELSEEMHTELIAVAVNMILEAIESKRYQTNNLELKRIE
jgi:hypothetical protein